MTTEQFIKDCAARGWSRALTAQELGISARKLRVMLEHLPGIEWPAPNKSILQRQSHESRRGQCSPANREALLKARRAQIPETYEINGRVGTVDELAKFAPVPAVTIRRRMSNGIDPALAFTQPPTPPHLRRHGMNKKDAAA